MRPCPWEKYYGNVPSRLSYPDVGMYELILEAAKKFPNKPAYGFMGSTTTYDEMMDEIDRLAEALVLHGVAKGDNVAICLPNCPQAIWSVYAANKCGAIAYMIYPLSSKNEIHHFIIDSGCKIAIVIDSVASTFTEASEGTDLDTIVYTGLRDPLGLVGKIAVKWLDGPKVEIPASEKVLSILDFMQGRKGNVPMPKVCGNDPALILFSGGTSGKAKEIVLSNVNANASAIQARTMIDNMEEGNCRTLTVMPIFHGFGLIGNLHMILVHGGYCEMVPRFNPGMFAELIGASKPDLLMGVPTLYEHLLASDLLKYMDLSFVKTVIVGGDTLTTGLRKRIETMFSEHGCDTVVRDGYGLTECVMLTCMTPKNGYKEGYIGIPCPDTFFKIVRNGTEEELPSDEVGQICISGPTVMQSCQTDNGSAPGSLKVHSDGMTWLHTSDLGIISDDGYVAYRGRIDRMVVTSGYNVYPNQIEDILNSHPAISSSCVIGIPDGIKMHVVKAFVVLNKNIEKTDTLIVDILKYCLDNLPRYSIPKDIRVVESMPRTKVGKISYNEVVEYAMTHTY